MGMVMTIAPKMHLSGELFQNCGKKGRGQLTQPIGQDIQKDPAIEDTILIRPSSGGEAFD